MPAQGVDRLETGLVGEVVADEYRQPPTEWRLVHEFADHFPLAGTTGLELEHALAGLQGQQPGMPPAEVLGQGASGLLQLGRQAKMQREGQALVLQVQPGVPGTGLHQLVLDLAQGLQIQIQPPQPTVGSAAFGTMDPGGRQAQRLEQAVEIRQPASGDHRDWHANGLQSVEGSEGGGRNEYQLGTGLYFGKRSVHIEEEGAVLQVLRTGGALTVHIDWDRRSTAQVRSAWINGTDSDLPVPASGRPESSVMAQVTPCKRAAPAGGSHERAQTPDAGNR